MAVKDTTSIDKASRGAPAAVAAVAGITYVAAWVVGLAIWLSNPDVASSGAAVVAGYAGHQGVAMVQFLLTEGVAAVALATVVVALARAARVRGEARLGRIAMVAGIVAAGISLTQCAIGFALAGWVVPAGNAGAAGVLFAMINRMDGVKMFVLAAMAASGVGLARAGVLPRWLGVASILLLAALIISGIGYLLLFGPLAVAAYASLPLLLVWVAATGVTLALGRGQ